MKNHCFALAVCLSLVVVPGLRAADLRTVCGDDAKSETKIITSGNQTYTIHMGGRFDGANTTIAPTSRFPRKTGFASALVPLGKGNSSSHARS